jgi:hypothetical protein
MALGVIKTLCACFFVANTGILGVGALQWPMRGMDDGDSSGANRLHGSSRSQRESRLALDGQIESNLILDQLQAHAGSSPSLAYLILLRVLQ